MHEVNLHAPNTDSWIFWQYGFFTLNATILFTWILMALLTLCAALITHRLTTNHPHSGWQNLLEIVVTAIISQIKDVGLNNPSQHISFLGTLFLFIATATIATVIPAMNHLQHHYRPQQLWLYVCWSLFRVLAYPVKG